MVNPASLAAFEAVTRSIGADTPKDKQILVATLRRTLGLSDEPPPSANAATDCVLSIVEVAARLSRKPRTVKYLVETGQLQCLRTGRTAKLAGIPASALAAYIEAGTARRREPAMAEG